ncbi:hypothetical protein [Streptomyces sp. SM10]|uniref:hypothetical protein n=1 Tax=Streptomyces sp. SM10 TaxID=565556 RepID=UPI0011AFDEE3
MAAGQELSRTSTPRLPRGVRRCAARTTRRSTPSGDSTEPYGSGPEDFFVDIVWWADRELLHHGAEIVLLRDLSRVRGGPA